MNRSMESEIKSLFTAGADSGGAIGAIAPLKPTKVAFFHHDFLQFGKQYPQYKVILQSIVLPQQCCEVYFVCLTIVNPQ